MAYQPIQMPGRPAMFDAMDQVAQSLGQVADDKHRARLEAEAKKRQDQQDFQATLLQAKKLMDAGDMQGAAALMAPYQAQLQQQGGAPPPAGKVPQQAGPSAGGSPLPDGMEFRPGHTDADFDTEHGQAPSQLPGPPSAVDRAQILSQMAPPGETLPPENPIMAARQAQKGQNQDRARQVLSFRAPGGQQMTIDPEAARASQLEQRSARLDAAFAGVDDPEIKQIYGKIRPVLLSSNQDVDPTDVFKYIQGVAADRRAAEAATARDATEAAREDRRDARQDKQLAQSDTNSRRVLQGMLAGLANRGNPAEDKQRAETVFDLKGNPVGRALSPDEGKEMHKAQAAANSLIETLGRIKEFNSEHGTRLVPGYHATEIKDRDVLASTATGYLTTMFQTGVLNGAEYDRYSKMLKGGWLQSGEGANQNLDTLAAGIADSYDNRVKSQGLGATQPAPPSPPAANPIAAARAHQRDKNNTRAGEAKRGGKGTAPRSNDDYLNMLGGTAAK